MAKGVIKKISRVRDNIHKQICSETDHSNLFARGLAYEGFNGGYLAALSDILLALDGVTPSRNNWWKDVEESQEPEQESGA